VEGKIMPTGRYLLRKAEIEKLPEYVARHPLNPDSEIHLRPLADTLGLRRLGCHLVRLAPDKEPNIYHSHRCEEEFYYILSGRGTVRIGDETFEVGPGDFMAFPAPSVPHVLRNTSRSDLVYLVGGERREFELGDFPEQNKLLVRAGKEMLMVDKEAIEEFKVSVERKNGSEF
jgi:uncharacterized cupin superfamily protein